MAGEGALLVFVGGFGLAGLIIMADRIYGGR